MQTALNRHEIPYLRSLLVQAKGMGLGSDSKYAAMLKSCDEAVERMKEQQELEIALNSAMRSKNVEKLAGCIANAQASGINIKLDSAIKMKTSLIQQKEITDHLTDAMEKDDLKALDR